MVFMGGGRSFARKGRVQEGSHERGPLGMLSIGHKFRSAQKMGRGDLVLLRFVPDKKSTGGEVGSTSYGWYGKDRQTLKAVKLGGGRDAPAWAKWRRERENNSQNRH